MKSMSIAILVLIVGSLYVENASAQFPITPPKIPKIKKTEPKPSDPAVSENKAMAEEPTRTAQPPSNNASCEDRTGALGVWLTDIETTRKEAEEYRPGLRSYYVQDFNDRENWYLKASLSPSRRKRASEGLSEAQLQCFTKALDGLAAVARKTLPTYHPTAYPIRNPIEEKVLMRAIDDISEATVFRGGFDSTAWTISKNGYGIPVDRYKHGIVWAKYPGVDDGFCRIIYVNLVQDYAGGGRYGASYGKFIVSEFAGCPAGK